VSQRGKCGLDLASPLEWSRAVARPLVLLCTLLLAMATPAIACQICFSGLTVTLGQQIDLSDDAVLATPQGPGQPLRVVAVVKGGIAPVGTTIEKVSRADEAVLRSGKPLLLFWNGLARTWTNIGAISVDHSQWLRQLATAPHTAPRQVQPAWRPMQASDLTGAEWQARLALVIPYLESVEPLAADIAYGEVSRAPYESLRAAKSRLDASALARWTEDPNLVRRRATYTLLLGVAGSPDDAARLEEKIAAALRAGSADDLAAMLAALLELRGSASVDFIERFYFVDPSRTLPEIEAALLALSVHGTADGTVPRQRVIQAYRLFMGARKPMAGFVAQDLADWGYWDATGDFVALLKADTATDPAAHFAIVSYLQRSPRGAAKAALRAHAQAAR
jgi:hypothetical protein